MMLHSSVLFILPRQFCKDNNNRKKGRGEVCRRNVSKNDRLLIFLEKEFYILDIHFFYGWVTFSKQLNSISETHKQAACLYSILFHIFQSVACISNFIVQTKLFKSMIFPLFQYLGELPVSETLSFTTKVFINDPSLSPGRHHIVTPITLLYDGKENDVLVYDVPFTIAGKQYVNLKYVNV